FPTNGCHRRGLCHSYLHFLRNALADAEANLPSRSSMRAPDANREPSEVVGTMMQSCSARVAETTHAPGISSSHGGMDPDRGGHVRWPRLFGAREEPSARLTGPGKRGEPGLGSVAAGLA